MVVVCGSLTTGSDESLEADLCMESPDECSQPCPGDHSSTMYMLHGPCQSAAPREAAHTETHRKVPCRCRENRAPASPHHPPRFFQTNFSDYLALEGKPAHCVCVYVHTARMQVSVCFKKVHLKSLVKMKVSKFWSFNGPELGGLESTMRK